MMQTIESMLNQFSDDTEVGEAANTLEDRTERNSDKLGNRATVSVGCAQRHMYKYGTGDN